MRGGRTVITMDAALHGEVREIVDDTPAIDVHSHLGTNGMWQARDLTDILHYHWLGMELRTAGCAQEVIHGREMDPRERVERTLPFMPAVRNTVNHWAFAGILRDLYGFEGDTLRADNWEQVSEQVGAKATDEGWIGTVLEKAKIEQVCVHYGGQPRDPSPFFHYEYGEPLYGVGLRGGIDAVERLTGMPISDADGLDSALTGQVQRLVQEHGVRCFHVWMPSSWRYREVSHKRGTDLIGWLKQGQDLTEETHNQLASFSADIMAREAGKHGLPVQLFHGSVAYGDGPQTAVWEPEWLRRLVGHIARNADTRFDLFLATRNAGHEATILARMYPNLIVSGAWWHGFTPTTLREFFRDRLEMLPMTRWNAFYSDGYCIEWVYGKLLVTKNRLALALAELVAEGLLAKDDVAEIARLVLYENPKRYYGLS